MLRLSGQTFGDNFSLTVGFLAVISYMVDNQINIVMEDFMKKVLWLVLAFGVVAFFGGCQKVREKAVIKKDYSRPLPPGELALRKLAPDEIPDMSAACSNLLDLKKAVERSIHYMNKPSSQEFFPSNNITHEHALQSLEQFKAMLDSGLTGKALHNAILENFDVYMSVGWDGWGTVLFTGYYTPIFEGSETPDDKYCYPLYGQPADLVKGPKGEILGRRVAGGLQRYPDRKELESSGMLKGNEIVYLADPFEVYIAHVQGSAKIRTPSGELLTFGYAANNGYEYRSISQAMVSSGALAKDEMNLSNMIKYFKAHPDKVAELTAANPRFVFFRKQTGEPCGSLNEEVTPMRSIATDKSIFPRASLCFVDTYIPSTGGSYSKWPFKSFCMDQDTGGAIRAPGRCDIYIGQGDDAGKRAGGIYEEGKLYYLFLKK